MSLFQGNNMYLGFIVPVVYRKSLMYMTICPTVLCNIQPLLSALMISLWSVFIWSASSKCLHTTV